MHKALIFIIAMVLLVQCHTKDTLVQIEQWTSHELVFTSQNDYSNSYIEQELWVEFVNDQQDTIIRPGFWNGKDKWIVRFAPPDANKIWNWTSHSKKHDMGLSGQQGELQSISYSGQNKLLKHGLLQISKGRRNVVHADGTPFLVVGDTPWAIPFRATVDQVKIYAADRQNKGFNTALLMSVQPDMKAEGPDKRNTSLGFTRGFSDLSEGHLNQLVPEYFQYLDTLIYTLLDHEIVPVYQPVFHGFGWKGLTTLGPTADPDEYARYCKYLVARYGSMPAFWLISGDGTGTDPCVNPSGKIVEKWDAYHQPAGIHYSPADNYMPVWANNDSTKCFHYNRSHQEEKWLDFQWAQSGHEGKHIYYKVEEMYENKPTKAVLNGEPTYEGMVGGTVGLGWWQGHEAWSQLMHGGTMGVVYGAAGLWQWKITANEEGWSEWSDQDVNWKTGLDLEGSSYVGFVSKAFEGFNFSDMEKRWELTENNQPLLAKENLFYISYLEKGGEIIIKNLPNGMPYYWFNPMIGEFLEEGITNSEMIFNAPDNNPWVLIVGEKN